MIRNLLQQLYVFAFALLAFSCGQNQTDHPKADLFFHTAEKNHFRISPSGTHISYLQDYEGFKTIFILDIASGNTRTVPTGHDVESAFWANDDELIFLLKRNPGDSLRLMSVNRDALDIRSILPATNAHLRWIAPIQVKNNEILISLNDRDSSVFDVYRLNILTGSRDLIAKNPGNIVRWLTDVEGSLRVAVVSNGLQETILARENEVEDFHQVINTRYKTRIIPLGFTKHDRNTIYALSNQNRDKLALVEFNLLTGKEMGVIYQNPKYDLSTQGYLKQTGEMGFAEYNGTRAERHFIDLQLKKVFQKLSSHIPDYSLEIVARDSTFTNFLIKTEQDVDPGATYYYNYKTDELILLAEESPGLDTSLLSPMKTVNFKARDGFELQGYLTVPKTSESNLPTIIIPPSDINSRAVWGYNPEVQFLVSRGYAVFQVNTRGLQGYGKQYWIDGFKKWGTTMQEDITDATQWLIQEGIADSTRVGIYGFNLGGYSALHSACYQPDLYACAASYSGITNLFTYLKEIPPYFKLYRQMFYEMVGNPAIESDYFRKHSPIFHAAKIKNPVFIAHGGKDSRVNVTEANQFVKDLRNREVPVEYILEPNEGRKFTTTEQKIDLYNQLADFFDSYLLKRR
ncbi:S9 family peptidase [Albibacterium indicum]|uniref:S9 family peptidase n=1 Tax=Albibacterium indicum TaxID=2292082 RepID=UPI000E50715C|nr:prolyl oligopeptidase family serine peptidase [Pedobacter indicus]